MLTTSFKLAKDAGACEERYREYARHVGGVATYGHDRPIPLTDILDVMGLDDTLWCLVNAIPLELQTERDRVARLFACDCAAHVLELFEARYPDDKRPRVAIETARRYAYGQATPDELAVAREASRATERDVWDAMRAPKTSNATMDVAVAAWATTNDDAKHAAVAASVVTRAAPEDAAGDAEEHWQVQRLRELLNGS